MQEVSSRFKDLASAESLWKLRAADIISMERGSTAMAALQLCSYRQLVETFLRIGIPGEMVGYWRADVKCSLSMERPMAGFDSLYENACRTTTQHYDDTGSPWVNTRGELLRILLVKGGFYCESIEPDGATHGVFSLSVSPSAGRGAGVLIDFTSHEGGGVANPLGAGSMVPFSDFASNYNAVGSLESKMIEKSGDGFYLVRNGCKRRYVALEPQLPPVAPLKSVSDLSGLWSAPYGSHGLEILHVMVDPCIQEEGTGNGDTSNTVSTSSGCITKTGDCYCKSNSNNSTCHPYRQLSGNKIIGDSNVPAGKLSFVINLDDQYDPVVELENDARPVVSFLSGGALIGELSTRLPNIKFWYKGRGQINRVPGVWQPEWVSVDCLVYVNGPSGFSVVWSEASEHVRVVVDFRRLQGCGVVWPETVQ
ncbi:unnamed protein product [Choristocarpus tenellus]